MMKIIIIINHKSVASKDNANLEVADVVQLDDGSFKTHGEKLLVRRQCKTRGPLERNSNVRLMHF